MYKRQVREGWQELWDFVHLSLGADQDATTRFMAYGMLTNGLLSMGFPPDHRVWTGLTLDQK